MRNFNRAEAAYPVLWKGCVGAWAPLLGPGGEILVDRTKNIRHARLADMDPASDWVISGGAYALDFDGTNDYVSVPRQTQIEGSTVYSMSAWIYGRSAVGAREYMAYRSTAASNPILMQLDTNGSDLRCIVRDDAATIANATAAGAFATSTWTHVAGVRRGNDVVLFKNGLQVASASASVGTVTVDRISFGAAFAGSATPSLFVDGQMDDMRIYNRGLTESEIGLLSRRRGIAYETRRKRSVKAAAGGNRRRRVLLMGSQ